MSRGPIPRNPALVSWGTYLGHVGSEAASNLPWHTLLGPLPAGAVPLRKAVASPETLATPSGWAIAGWEQLTVELSAGNAGLRVVLVVLDASGQPISASDAVLYRIEAPRGCTTGKPDAPVRICQDSIGGRIEPDGTFRGTVWHTEAPEPAGEEEPTWESKRSEPTAGQISALMDLVAEVVRRQPRRV